MARRDEIVQYANELLDAPSFTDYCTNGLQVTGAEEVTSLASAVSCTLEVFDAAAAIGAQMLVVHHGLFWRNTPLLVDHTMRGRLKALFDADINLLCYHLPLDAHHRLGNNALIRSMLELEPVDVPFAMVDGTPIGRVGAYAESLTFPDFMGKLANVIGQEPLHLGATPDEVRTVAICSGGGAHMLAEAVALGADVLVTGEPSEPTHAAATEAGIAFIAAGHYATEVCGVYALGDQLAGQFGLDHTFLPSPNPV